MNRFLTIAFLLIAGYAAFADSQDEITRAISEGNCEFLFNFVQNPEGKDKKLIDSANNTIKRYARPDLQAENYRTNSMDTRVRGVGVDLTKRLFEDPQKYLPIVTAKLIIGVSGQFLRTKIIHDWICYHIAYDADTFLGKANRGQDYISVIKNKKAVCAGDKQGTICKTIGCRRKFHPVLGKNRGKYLRAKNNSPAGQFVTEEKNYRKGKRLFYKSLFKDTGKRILLFL
jgi:hypothetical protein